MDSLDRMKLMKAGFRIFRQHEYEKRITECTDKGGWKLHAQYSTKAAMNRAWKELKSLPEAIGD